MVEGLMNTATVEKKGLVDKSVVLSINNDGPRWTLIIDSKKGDNDVISMLVVGSVMGDEVGRIISLCFTCFSDRNTPVASSITAEFPMKYKVDEQSFKVWMRVDNCSVLMSNSGYGNGRKPLFILQEPPTDAIDVQYIRLNK